MKSALLLYALLYSLVIGDQYVVSGILLKVKIFKNGLYHCDGQI